MDQGQADIILTPELMSAQIFREKFVNLKAGLKYTFKVSSDTIMVKYKFASSVTQLYTMETYQMNMFLCLYM